MCLILFAHNLRADLPLVLLANRDEYFARPTRPAAPWPGTAGMVAGRDLAGGRTVLVERSFTGAPERWSQRSYRLAGGESSLDY